MASDWRQVCQGPRFRYLDNGQVEVEGQGVILSSDNYWGDLANIPRVQAAFGDMIQAASEKHGVPPLWMRSIAVVEGGWKYPTFINSAGAGGVMAMTPGAWFAGTGVHPSSDDIKDPAKNIEASAAFLRTLVEKHGDLPAVAAAYNAGAPKCSPTTRCKDTIGGSWDFDGTSAENSFGMVEDCTNGRSSAYSRRAVEINNTLVEMGYGGTSSSVSVENVVAAVVGLAAGFVLFRNFVRGLRCQGLLLESSKRLRKTCSCQHMQKA